ncbi:MAG: type 4a pilus biogenesis protein PilO [Deltaproteobacteria bacterium]|nr:type 4a pilus biogenesis protein PilO [Deltaproteobacteria bacterium]MBW2119133.1 type 4a pilus biogenesis protein PilO [Deltaproteobacteria bacterium]MBW2345252.1 type 4a pilus biogenesis protein PilO [Deltaproteobacteria bacterium]
MAEGSFFATVEKIKMPIRILILVGTLGLLGGAFFFLIYQPKTDEIRMVKDEISGLKVKVMKARRDAKRLPEVEAREIVVDAQFKQALRLLPNEKEVPSLLRNITKLGAASNLEFRLFIPKKESPEHFYYRLPVSIEVSGNYHDVATFFDKVGKMERIVNILNVSMKPQKTRSTMLITKCEAVTYRFKGTTDDKAKKKRKKKK